MKVLNNIKKIRWERNMSSRQLAELSGVSHSMINKIENGKSYPTQITILLISQALNLKAEEVFELDYNNLSLYNI
jgi:transcriptional regulator with XRE-family HTH domain